MTIRYSKRLYRQRNCIERVLGHLKINRAIATRYDQLADSFLGMLFIASVRYWIKFVHTAKYKSKPHAIAINTNQIAIFPNLGTCP